MVCAPVRSIIPSVNLGDYLSVQAQKPCSISHLFFNVKFVFTFFVLVLFHASLVFYLFISFHVHLFICYSFNSFLFILLSATRSLLFIHVFFLLLFYLFYL